MLEQIAALLAPALTASGLPREGVAQVLEHQGEALAADMVAVLRARVEAMTGLVCRRWKVDRNQSSQAVLEGTGRKVYANDEVVAAMPRGEGEEGETIFFKLDLSQRGGYISDTGLDEELDLRGLEDEFPDNLAALNKADPVLADTHPNACRWKDKNGKRCYAAFRRWGGERRVLVGRGDYRWLDSWWFAGRRKLSTKPSVP